MSATETQQMEKSEPYADSYLMLLGKKYFNSGASTLDVLD